jgi:Oligosaccharyltransferase subunit 5
MSDYPLGTYATVKACQFSTGSLFNLSDCVQHLHKIVPAFTPYVPVGVLSYLAFILLTATFGLAFYFTTYVIKYLYSITDFIKLSRSLSKSTIPLRESAVAVVASTLGGYGIVALFCSVGVYV